MIIGLTGYAGSGKSTVAKYLAENYGFGRVNFKDGLVQEIKDNFPDLLKHFASGYMMTIDQLFEQKPPEMRALMQNYGTEVRRKDNEHHWVKKYCETIGYNPDKNFVTDDVRFQNEYDAIKLLNGVVIRVTRPDITTGGSHSSETEQDSFEADFTIVGEPGSHDSIYKQIESIIETIKSNHD